MWIIIWFSVSDIFTQTKMFFYSYYVCNIKLYTFLVFLYKLCSIAKFKFIGVGRFNVLGVELVSKVYVWVIDYWIIYFMWNRVINIKTTCWLLLFFVYFYNFLFSNYFVFIPSTSSKNTLFCSVSLYKFLLLNWYNTNIVSP